MSKRGLIVGLVLFAMLLSTVPALALDPFATGYTDRVVKVSATFEDQDGHTVESGAMRGDAQYYAVVKATWYAMSFEGAMGNFFQAVQVSAGGGQEWALRDPNGNVVSDQGKRLSTLGVKHFGPGTVFALVHDWNSMSVRVKLTGGTGQYMLGAESFAKTLRQGVGVSLTPDGAILMFDNYEFTEIVGEWCFFNLVGGEWWPTKEKVVFDGFPGDAWYVENYYDQGNGTAVKVESDQPSSQNFYIAGYPVRYETWRQIQGQLAGKYYSRVCKKDASCGPFVTYFVLNHGFAGDQSYDWRNLPLATKDELATIVYK